LAVLTAVFLYFAGTSFVIPFLPLYVIELDHVDVATAAIWSGAILGIAPLVSGFAAPFWGTLSDRYGHKLLLQRSLIGFTVCLALLAVASSSWQLLLIRVGTGLVGGFSVAAQAMVSVGAPPRAITGAIGRTNAARVLGMAIGPLPGGLLADTIGVRGACTAAVAGGLVALLVVTFVAVAPARGAVQHRARSVRRRLPWRADRLIGLVFSVTTVRLVEKSFDPVLPLFIAQLSGNPFGAGVTTAVVSSSGLLAAAFASSFTGGLGEQGVQRRGIVLAALLAAAALLTVATYFAAAWWVVLIFRSIGGAALGVAGSLGVAEAALRTDPKQHGRVMGVLGSGTAFGSAGGQIGAGLLAILSLPAVFLADAALLIGAAATVIPRRRSELLQRSEPPLRDHDDKERQG